MSFVLKCFPERGDTMNLSTEQEKYSKAKLDILQAKDSYDKLTPEQQDQLIIELFGSRAIVELARRLKEMG